MKTLFTQVLFFFSAVAFAQETGTIAGALTDQEMNNEPLPFANVSVKNTSKGTTSDFDGLFKIEKIPAGTYTLIVSFIGYESIEVPQIKVSANQITNINTSLVASAASLDEVMITAVSRRDSEVALLLDQKEAIDIKESIGSQELSKLGVSDAATATTKISGVTSSEASGDVYVRGLGDRYLYTTLNGLTIPSDNIDKKNIDLGLFPTRVVQSVSISKNFSPESSADQASGSVNITSKSLTGLEEFNFGTQVGINSNAISQENFKRSANANDFSFGFYSKETSTKKAITAQTWDSENTKMPIDYQYSISAGKKIGEKFKIFFTGSQSSKFEYTEGIFQQFNRNLEDVRFTDATYYTNTVNTTGLLDLKYDFDRKNELRAVSMFVNKMTDEVYESGRNRQGFVFEEVNNEEQYSQFVKDQNTKQTQLWINQLLGDHEIGERNQLSWGLGYNQLDADEPNRIRNEVNIKKPINTQPEMIELANQGGTQQRKSLQNIDDLEYTARIKDEFKVFENDTLSSLKIAVGANYRKKTRDFEADKFGVDEIGAPGQVTPPSLDNLSAVFTPENFDNGVLRLVEQQADTYQGELNSAAGFVSVNYAIKKFNFNLGARYQKDEILVDYNVGNAPGGREGSTDKNYNNLYPSLHIKYAYNKKNNFRFAASKTITLPEFKEIAPFGYVSPTNQIVVGNTKLEASNVYNLDLKWEFFPSRKELVSVTGFYKHIQDPINRTLDRGSSGYFTFFNTSEKAEVYGLELEANLGLISSEEKKGVDFDLSFNFTKMWHHQDLKTNYNEDGSFANTFKYNDKTKIGLEGASDYIINAALNLSTNWEKEFNANISGNYASDKIYAIGSAPDSQTVASNLYNNEIIEKGFVVINANFSQEITKRINLNLKAINLLDPKIERTQEVRDIASGNKNTETLRSYRNGISVSMGVNYQF